MASGQEVMVRSQFTNQAGPGSAKVRAFIMNYMLRPGAVEPLVVDEQRQLDVIRSVTKLRSPEDRQALTMTNKKLKYDGVGFDLNHVAMTRQQMWARAREAQQAYDRGATVKQMVISFDTSYLKKMGLISDDVKEPIKRGDFRGQVDQERLRMAVQDGIQALVAASRMHQPQIAAAIQTDTAQLHVHLCLWDNDPKVKNDRGKLSQEQLQAFRDGLETSLDLHGPSMNSTRSLTALAQLTQKNATFKFKLLQQQLQESAMFQDRLSTSGYIRSLAQFDQRSLSMRQRENLEQLVRMDYQRVGRPAKRSHTLTLGQRRARRQIDAERQAVRLRTAIRGFNRQAAMGHVSQPAMAVKRALMVELQHQQMVVEKYRRYQRPRTEMIYLNRYPQLMARRTNLQQQRQQLLRQLGGYRLRQPYLQRLLGSQRVMQGIAESQPGVPMNQNRAYQEMRQAQSDGFSPLSDSTIHAVTKHLDQDERRQVDEILHKNQRAPDWQRLDTQRRRLLFQYLEDLDDYEADLASWGGMSTEKWYQDYQSGQTLPQPTKPESIYERDDHRDYLDEGQLLASDVHHVVKSAPLKPEVEWSMMYQLRRRQRYLQEASDYFVNTGQDKPAWLENSQQDVGRQYEVLTNCTSKPVKLQAPRVQKKVVAGYELDQPVRQNLVEKHLKETKGLVI